MRPLDEAIKRRYCDDFRWRPGWGPLLEAAKLHPVEVGSRHSSSLRQKREYYAICERVK
jgi:hypothetical protein